MLKTLVIDTYDSSFGNGLEREDVRPIFDSFCPVANDATFEAWWKAARSLRVTYIGARQSFRMQIQVVLDTEKDGPVISFALLSHPDYIRLEDYSP